MISAFHALGSMRLRHGRRIASRITAANSRRMAVVPCAPMAGKTLLAREAPLWIETMATNRSAMG
ncbi:hypothetical protein D3C81_1525070 [compost metagenome]